MLKFIKEHAATIGGIDIYPIISMLIFVIFFVAVLYYVKIMDREQVKEISSLPLDLDANQDQEGSLNKLKQA